MQIKNSHSSETSLIAISYWSFGLGFGPLLPIAGAWVFRKNYFLCTQLLQSAFIQFIFFVISFSFFLGFILNNYYGNADKITFVLMQETINWFARLILFVFSLIIWNQKSISFPVIYSLVENIIKFCKIKKLKRAFALNCLWAGFGQLYLGQSWLGWLFVFCQVATFLSLFHIWFSYYNFSISKDLLGVFGFYWRIGDQAFSEGFATLYNVFILIGLFIINYILSFISLYAKLPQRRIMGSILASYLLHFAVFWIILLTPFILTKSSTEEAIKQKAKKIEQQLSEEQKQKNKNKTKQIPSPNTNKEIQFDLELPKQINGLNQFSSRPILQDTKYFKVHPNIGFGERKQPLPSRKEYIQKHKHKTKSYSEYLTAKVREGDKDKIIWNKTSSPYSSVIEYIISANGDITSIKILEHSNNLSVDSMVISVLESMAPLKKPPNNKDLKITELFWNTNGQQGLDSNLKRSLVNYPDGRIIEEL